MLFLHFNSMWCNLKYETCPLCCNKERSLVICKPHCTRHFYKTELLVVTILIHVEIVPQSMANILTRFFLKKLHKYNFASLHKK